MRQVVSMLAAGLVLAGCAASTQRALSYPGGQADADILVGTHRYQAWFHEADPTLLLMRGPPRSFGRLMLENSTIYAADRTEPEAVWQAAANAVLQPLGCQANEITGADQLREVKYSCAFKDDVWPQIEQRRAQWRQGVRVDDPTGPETPPPPPASTQDFAPYAPEPAPAAPELEQAPPADLTPPGGN